MYRTLMRRKKSIAAAVLLSSVFSFSAIAAGPEVVAGPAADAQCFVPWSDKTKFFKFKKKEGPYRIALANGFIANTWRIPVSYTHLTLPTIYSV